MTLPLSFSRHFMITILDLILITKNPSTDQQSQRLEIRLPGHGTLDFTCILFGSLISSSLIISSSEESDPPFEKSSKEISTQGSASQDRHDTAGILWIQRNGNHTLQEGKEQWQTAILWFLGPEIQDDPDHPEWHVSLSFRDDSSPLYHGKWRFDIKEETSQGWA